MFKGIIAATASLGLMATPAMAQVAAPLPSTESVSGMAQDDTGGGGPNWAIIVGAVIAVGLGLWALLDNGNDHPASP